MPERQLSIKRELVPKETALAIFDQLFGRGKWRVKLEVRSQDQQGMIYRLEVKHQLEEGEQELKIHTLKILWDGSLASHEELTIEPSSSD